MNYLIIGDGAAGTTAAQTIRQRDQNGTITILSDDPNAAYYRAALTNYLIGELNESQLWAVPPSFYRDLRIDRRFGHAFSIDTTRQHVTLDDGTTMPYDKLLIATGSRARKPPFIGREIEGVMVMRTLRDVQRVMNLVKMNQLKHAVIAGGGPLAMEWVVGLHRRGVAVSYLLRRDHLMRRTLDKTASDLTLSRMRLEGIDVRVNSEIDEAIGEDQVESVRLKSGETIACQLVGVAIGVECNSEWVRQSAVSLHPRTNAVLVDETMATGVENVWAAGDVAQVGEHLLQLWEPARLQGRIAGTNMAATSPDQIVRFKPGAHYNATRLYDLDFASVGDLTGKDDEEGVETLIDFPREGKKITYRKLFLRNGRLVGAILLGDVSENVRRRGRRYKQLIDSGLDVTSLVDGALLDSHFDLRSWIEVQLTAHEMSPKIRPQKSAASLRKTQSFQLPEPETVSNSAIQQAPAEQPPQLHYDGKQVALTGREIQVGRSPDGNQLVLNDPGVSHVHAQITEQNGDWYVRDVGSSNGTFVNDERVMTPRRLRHGDVIIMGKTTMQFGLAGRPLPQIASQDVTHTDCPHCQGRIRVGVKFCPHCGQSTSKKKKRRVAPPVSAVPSISTATGATGLTLKLIAGEQLGRQLIVEDHAWIGRDFNCELVLTDRTVSGRHIELVRRENQYYVRDWASQNGSALNGKRLTGEFRPIQADDTLRLGNKIRIRVMP